MPISRYFKLYLNAGRSIPLVINANQYDSGETWYFTLYTDTGEAYIPSSGAIIGIKSDGHVIDNAATVDSRGRVVVTETEQMTAAAGKAVFEISIDDNSHGSANFIVLVEPKPSDDGILSDSDLSLIQEAINSTNPAAIAQGVSDWMDENLTPTTPVVDASLTVQGAAADAKKTGDEISDLKSQIQQSSGLTADIKQALMDFANAVAFKSNVPLGQTYIDALEDALYPPVDLLSITAVYTQSGTVYDTDSLDDLKADLVVTAHYSDSTTGVVTNYALTGTLAVGTSTITVTYGGKTTTFTVEVTYDSPYLYELPASVVMAGTDSIDTGVEFEEGQIITILIDLTPTTIDGTLRFAYSNQIDTENTYLGLQFKKDANMNYMWGMGRGWNAGKSVVAPNKQYRVAVVAETTASACDCTQYVRNVTDSTTLASVNTTYTAMTGVLNDNTIKIGDATTGFIGTIHDFKIYNGEMASADITSWLEGA